MMHPPPARKSCVGELSSSLYTEEVVYSPHTHPQSTDLIFGWSFRMNLQFGLFASLFVVLKVYREKLNSCEILICSVIRSGGPISVTGTAPVTNTLHLVDSDVHLIEKEYTKNISDTRDLLGPSPPITHPTPHTPGSKSNHLSQSKIVLERNGRSHRLGLPVLRTKNLKNETPPAQSHSYGGPLEDILLDGRVLLDGLVVCNYAPFNNRLG